MKRPPGSDPPARSNSVKDDGLLRVNAQGLGKNAVIVIVTGDDIGHMFSTPLNKGAVFGKKGLTPIGHSNAAHGTSGLGRGTRKILMRPPLPQQLDLRRIITMNCRRIHDAAEERHADE
ncbi:MAG: hypothetical protein RLZZ627_1360 [Pseudomonadota bacterium]